MPFTLFLLALLVGCTPGIHDYAGQRSTYLQQSQTDNINWHLWSEASVNKAVTQKKLIYLTIGYGTCFACQRTQTEIYDSAQISEVLNENFIAIRVDRNERPDLDAYFLNMQTAIMGFGSWPIQLILTPDLQPIFATTFMAQTQFRQLLDRLQKSWMTERDKIKKESQAFLDRTRPVDSNEQSLFQRDQTLIKDFYSIYTHRFDTLYGGLKVGRNFAPKFPVTDDMRLLLRYHLQSKEAQPLKMVKKTLSTVANSASFDQVEGGFHRYSLARNWNVPNFEKTLTDQAGYILALSELNKVAPNPLYTRKIEQTVSYVLSHLKSPLGGFYSAQASGHKRPEGLYYTWQRHELQSNLTKEVLAHFDENFSLTPPVPQYSQRRAIYSKTSFSNIKRSQVVERLKAVKQERKRPSVDNNVVTAKTAYLLSALAQIARHWPSKEFSSIVQDNLDFILNQHRNLSGHLYRQSIGGVVQHPGILDDYSFLIDALIEHYQLTFQEKYLFFAKDLQEIQDELFYDQNKKLYRHSLRDPLLPPAPFVLKDPDVPSGQSMAFWNLIRLARYFENTTYEMKANNLLQAYPDQLKKDPLSYKHLLLALDFHLAEAKTFTIKGDLKECRNQVKKLESSYFPYKLLSCAHRKSDLPLHKRLKEISVSPSFRICYKQSCSGEFSSFEQAKSFLLEGSL